MTENSGSCSMQELQVRLWRKLSTLIDGMALSSTVFALRRNNILRNLQGAAGPVAIEELADGRKIRAGYYHLAFRLLEDQGFVTRSIHARKPHTQALLTADGRSWLKMTPRYEAAMEFYGAAACLSRHGVIVAAPDCSLHDIGRQPELEQRVSLHVVSPLVIALLVFLYDNDLLSLDKNVLNEQEIMLAPDLLACCLDMLRGLGWLLPADNGKWTFSEEGKFLPFFVPQLFYPLSYMKTFQQVPDLIFPGRENRNQDDQLEESHIDRSLDIRFSGLVYRNNYREPVGRILEAVFNREPLDEQPRYLVDTGSGDGTVLLDVYRNIAGKTLRGRSLDSHPLTVVGIEYNRVAEQATAARLRENRIPFLTMPGDISRPEKIGEKLARLGILPELTLHISKSVIHNRRYAPYAGRENLDGWIPSSQAVFIDSRGALIDRRDMVSNLIDHFRRWQPLVRRHGMIAIEAHCVSPSLIAASLGSNILTCLDSSHGYSHQYLVEKDIYHRAIRMAGYEVESVMERSLPGVAATVLTVDYLRPL